MQIYSTRIGSESSDENLANNHKKDFLEPSVGLLCVLIHTYKNSSSVSSLTAIRNIWEQRSGRQLCQALVPRQSMHSLPLQNSK